MKKILLILFVGFVGIISFCSADLTGQFGTRGNYTVNANSSRYLGGNIPPYSVYCFSMPDISQTLSCEGAGRSFTFNRYYSVCLYNNSSITGTDYLYCSNSNSIDITIVLTNFKGLDKFFPDCPSCPECPACPEVNTGAILSGYVPESQLISCQSDLSSCNSSLSSCLENSCPETELSYSKFYVKHGESAWSQLSGTEFYYVYLPEYLGFNYDYSNNGRDLDFTVGVSVDTGYLSEVIDVQNYQPTSDDFSKLVGLFGSYGGLLIACLFVIIVFYLIKKMFK